MGRKVRYSASERRGGRRSATCAPRSRGSEVAVERRMAADGTLFDAAWIGDEAGIVRLLADGVSPTDEMSGLSPLHLACASGSVGAAQALLRGAHMPRIRGRPNHRRRAT